MRRLKIKNKNRLILMLVLVLLLLSLIFISFANKNEIKKVGENQLKLEIAGEVINTSNILSDDPNPPQLGAGMIPIKWNGKNYQITTESDTEWYNYSEGKMAIVMLSDGKYVSEERYNMKGHELIPEESKLPEIATEDLGTIYVWVPRLVYVDENYKYLQDTSMIEYENYTIPNCFEYKQKKQPKLALLGVWIQQTPEQNINALNQKITQMKKEDNDQGLIKNELVEKATGIAIKSAEKIQQKSKKSNLYHKLIDIDNTNRSMIRIINQERVMPIEVSSKVTGEGQVKTISIDVTALYGVHKIVRLDTNSTVSTSDKATLNVSEDGTYKFVVVDTRGNIKYFSVRVGSGIPDLTGFRVDTTYVVTWYEDEDGNIIEDSETPIEEILKPGYKTRDDNTLIEGAIDGSKVSSLKGVWYDYPHQKWANIVTRNFSSEAYFVWIPRYVYKLDQETQTSSVKLVGTEVYGEEIPEGYQLPEAFTWGDDPDEMVQLPGFWMSKYELEAATPFNLKANVVGGINKIKVGNITDETGISDNSVYYDIYLYKAGVNKNKVVPGDEVDLITDAKRNSSYVFNKSVDTRDENGNTDELLEIGDYDIRIVLKDGTKKYRGEEWFTATVIATAAEPTLPDLTGYRINTTYMVAYSDEMQENSMNAAIPIKDIIEDNSVIDPVTNVLKKGKVDKVKLQAAINKISEETGTKYEWYDYAKQKWANIVVRNAGSEAYYTWIPRYVYKLDSYDQASEIQFVGIEVYGDEIPEGWKLPEAFTWGDNEENLKQLSGFWMSKYELETATDFNLHVNNDDHVMGGTNRITINDVASNLDNANKTNMTYKIYVYDYDTEGVPNEFKVEPEVEPGEIMANGEYNCLDSSEVKRQYVRYWEMKPGDSRSKIFDGMDPHKYAVRIVAYDERGYYRGEKWYKDYDFEDKQSKAVHVIERNIPADVITIDVTGFRQNTTFLAVYSDANAENSLNATIPLSKVITNDSVIDDTTNVIKSGDIDKNKLNSELQALSEANGVNYVWYDYDTQRWANIVVRNAGSEAYYTYIPRYIYRLDQVLQRSEVRFVTIDEDLSYFFENEWKLPEAFTWGDGNENIKQLHGYWMSKYELETATDFNLHVSNDDTVLGGTNKIIINDVASNLDNANKTNMTYKIYVYDYDTEGVPNEFKVEPEVEPGEIMADGEYNCLDSSEVKRQYVRYWEMKPGDSRSKIFYGMDPHKYAVRIVAYDERGYYRGEKWYKDYDFEDKQSKAIQVLETGKNVNQIITIDMTGFEPDCTYYVTYDENNVETRTKMTDVSSPPEGWYDYKNQKWANIVVSNGGNEAYFVYIPRYIYKLDQVRQASEIQFVGTNIYGDSIPAGWNLPEAFTWGDDAEHLRQLPGYWISKYELSAAN